MGTWIHEKRRVTRPKHIIQSIRYERHSKTMVSTSPWRESEGTAQADKQGVSTLAGEDCCAAPLSDLSLQRFGISIGADEADE